MKKIALWTLILLLVITLAGNAYAGEKEDSQSIEVTLEEAINRALSRSEALEKADWDREQAEDAKDEAVASFHPAWFTDYAGSDEPYVAYYSAKSGAEIADLNYIAERDKVIYSTVENYYNVLLALKNVENAEAALELEQLKLKIAELKYQVGMDSYLSLLQARTKVADAEKELTEAENALENTYLDFNQLVGFASAERPILTDFPEYEPLSENESLGFFVQRALDESPVIEISKETVNLQEQMKGWGDYQEGDFEKAELDEQIAREATKQIVRSLYFSLLDLEKQYEALQEQVKLLEENLRAKQLMFEVGMATKLDVQEAEVSLLNAKNALFALTVNHELMRHKLEKPWVMESTSSGS